MEDASLVRLARGLLCVTTLEVVRAARDSNNSRRRRVEPYADCSRHPKDRVKARIAVLAERLVQTLAAEARLLGDLAHTDGAGDVTERARDAGCIIRGLDEPRLEIGRHFLRRPELLRDVVDNRVGVPCSTARGLGRGALRLR